MQSTRADINYNYAVTKFGACLDALLSMKSCNGLAWQRRVALYFA